MGERTKCKRRKRWKRRRREKQIVSSAGAASYRSERKTKEKRDSCWLPLLSRSLSRPAHTQLPVSLASLKFRMRWPTRIPSTARWHPPAIERLQNFNKPVAVSDATIKYVEEKRVVQHIRTDGHHIWSTPPHLAMALENVKRERTSIKWLRRPE